jgi:phage tail-like protein
VPQLGSYDGLDFRVKWDGKYVSGVSRIGPILRTTEVTPFRAGSAPAVENLSPGATTFQPITIERPRTLDTTFEDWANLLVSLNNLGVPEPAQTTSFRKNITLDLYNGAGQLILSFNVYQCWPSSYEPVCNLETDSPAVVLERLTLQNEGWARDTSVVPPAS